MLSITNPRQTVLISSRAIMNVLGKDMQKDNLMALDWHTPLSFDPMLYGFSIKKNRYSYEIIKKSGVFSINFMSHDHVENVKICGRIKGETVDKFVESKLTKKEAEKIDCSIVDEAVAHMECEVINELNLGDHAFIIGKIIFSNLKQDKPRVFHVEGDKFIGF